MVLMAWTVEHNEAHFANLLLMEHGYFNQGIYLEFPVMTGLQWRVGADWLRSNVIRNTGSAGHELHILKKESC